MTHDHTSFDCPSPRPTSRNWGQVRYQVCHLIISFLRRHLTHSISAGTTSTSRPLDNFRTCPSPTIMVQSTYLEMAKTTPGTRTASRWATGSEMAKILRFPTSPVGNGVKRRSVSVLLNSRSHNPYNMMYSSFILIHKFHVAIYLSTDNLTTNDPANDKEGNICLSTCLN